MNMAEKITSSLEKYIDLAERVSCYKYSITQKSHFGLFSIIPRLRSFTGCINGNIISLTEELYPGPLIGDSVFYRLEALAPEGEELARFVFGPIWYNDIGKTNNPLTRLFMKLENSLNEEDKKRKQLLAFDPEI